MAKKSLAKSVAAKNTIKQLGHNIQTARKRRRMTQKELAGRILCSLPTIGRLEAGDPGISLGVLAEALRVMGMENQLQHLASPETDIVGMQEQMRNSPERIRKSKKEEKRLDF